MPRVSVLLTCYNHLPYLRQAVDDLQAQTFTDFEVVALDDGSVDGSREWLTYELPQRLPRVRVELNERNLGTYATLNRGLGLAAGEYIAILNDDDRWAPAKLERQVDVLDQGAEFGLVHTGGWFIDGEGGRIDGAPLGFPFPRTRSGDIFVDLVLRNHIIHSGALFRRRCVERVGPYSDQFYGCGDWHLWLRIAEHWHVAFVEEPLTFYRIHGAKACLDLDRMNDDSRAIRKWLSARTPEILRGRPGDAAVRLALAHNEACLGT